MRVEVAGTIKHQWTATLDVPDEIAERWFRDFEDGGSALDSEIFENWISPKDHYDEGTDAEVYGLRKVDPTPTATNSEMTREDD